ncbi:FtsX-like permease family protein [Clostridium tyrobutyricum]|jgi:cell division transport system permease protein|uniref:Cell division protein FtsX n=1 Tax=Clostridium tyrobutyricum DIVETGP TaxID=1408889 RepID=W6N419_CLOTY|nr:permease-like cell division protein FtsX [Clostridium tyrobutyricum]AND86025.1 cell division protein FtsX [Clostridium tyrobutyricum]ANP70525.1 cell division protein FtsX [Clostridium tyrobutyricum]MBR9647440.1 ABC transporter permease [Clostridium tyrobutyricum]MBV4416885.1 permease-like cell division protein FtsX [Clostridium tyrobutyricum]MBV4422978.1 permease-like cell division protein FtsX [Clostridium tyrobutyricum]
MRISTIKFFISESLKSLNRNKTISTASVATVAATLFILGVSILAMVNVNQGILQVQSKVEVDVYLKDNITSSQKKDLENKIKSNGNIQSLTYVTKSQAVDKFRNQLGEQNKSLVDGLEKDNPLPNSYIIKVTNPEYVSKLVSSIQDMPGIESIQDGKGIVDKIVKITRTVRWIGIVILVIMVGVSLFLIGNTIRLTVYSRRREIGIMKYIGATDWFIRWPFIIEGIIIGIIGAGVADIILYYLYRMLYFKTSSSLILMQLISPQYVYSNILGIFLLVGVIIGALGSLLSIRKFLAV